MGICRSDDAGWAGELYGALLGQGAVGVLYVDAGLRLRAGGVLDEERFGGLVPRAGAPLPDLVIEEQRADLAAYAREVLDSGVPHVPSAQRTWRLAVDTPVHVALTVLRSRPWEDPAGHGLVVAVTDHTGDERLLRVYRAVGETIGTRLDVTVIAQQLADAMTRTLGDVAVVSVSRAIPDGTEPPRRTDGGDLLLVRAAVSPADGDYPPGYILPGGKVPPFKSPEVIKTFQRGEPFALTGRAPITAVVDDDPGMVAALVPLDGPLTVMSAPLVTLAGPDSPGLLLGSLEVWRRDGPPFTDAEVATAADVARRTASLLDTARRTAALERQVERLQAALLPAPRTTTAAVRAAGAYRPAGGARAGGGLRTGGSPQPGGDWYDVIPLPGGRAVLTVGDVVGHGQDAVATMGRLRTSVRTLADQDLAPDELLAQLDTITAGIADEGSHHALGSSCLYAVVDPVDHRVSVASAGHPPPLAVGPDGRARVVPIDPGPVLGLGGRFEVTQWDDVPPGTLLAMFTDGVTDARADPDAETDRLLALLADAGPQASPDEVAARLVDGGPDHGDDATALVARTRAIPARHSATWTWPATDEAAGHARRALRAFLPGLSTVTEDQRFAVELAVSELVTNAVRYGATRYDVPNTGDVTLRLVLADGRLNVEVTDATSTAPHLRRARADDEGGRGLDIVQHLGTRWGTRFLAAPGGGPSLGKTIWVQIAVPDAPG